MCESPLMSSEKWHTYFRCHLRGLNRCLWPFPIIRLIWREPEIMDVQAVTFLPFNRVNYILSVGGAISAGDCNCLGFFICIGSKFMKFQWTLICLHWFILTADLWNFNFLFILSLLEMESLSDNWLQWMEMIWSVLKQMRFALCGFAVTILAWFDFFFSRGWSLHLHACLLFSPHSNMSTLWSGSTAPEYLTFFERIGSTPYSTTGKKEKETPPSSPVDSAIHQLDEVIMCVDAALNSIHLTDCRCLEGLR